MQFALLIPSYNEVNNIGVLLEQIAKEVHKQSAISVIAFIIDDNSPDGTAQLAQEVAQPLQTDTFSVKIIYRAQKEGLGRAYVEGFQHVLLSNTFDYAIQMDADLSHDPKYFKCFFESAKRGVDFVIASRYAKGGGIPKWRWHRRLLSLGGNAFARLLLGQSVSDYTGGFNMYSISLLKQINFNELQMSGYGFLIGLKFQAAQSAKTIEHFPIIFLDRIAGQSKMPLNTAFRSFFLVLRLCFKK